MIYARFILAHLNDPAERLNSWIKELNPNGLLLAEEIEDIQTGVKVFNRYLEINKGLILSEGANLYAGKLLAEGNYDAEILYNGIVNLTISNCDAAAMFYLNTINIWEKESYVLRNVSPNERQEISNELLSIRDSKDRRKQIAWSMRRIALRKAKPDPYFCLFI